MADWGREVIDRSMLLLFIECSEKTLLEFFLRPFDRFFNSGWIIANEEGWTDAADFLKICCSSPAFGTGLEMPVQLLKFITAERVCGQQRAHLNPSLVVAKAATSVTAWIKHAFLNLRVALNRGTQPFQPTIIMVADICERFHHVDTDFPKRIAFDEKQLKRTPLGFR